MKIMLQERTTFSKLKNCFETLEALTITRLGQGASPGSVSGGTTLS